jgi:ankyrin repeat protein
MSNHVSGPVHVAVMRGSLPELIAAVESGHPVDEKDREGRTPLFYAVMAGELGIASELIRRGANPSAQDRHRETPLHFAAREYRIEGAELLLRTGAPVDARDVDGNTPLWRSVFDSRGRGRMIRLLLSHGADRSLKNEHGISPEDLAKTIANYDVRQFLA